MNNTEITQRRLQNQGLSKIIFKNAQDVVSQLGAVQSQDFSGAKWAISQRLKNETDESLDKEFTNAAILRTHVMRPTWHFVTPQDIRWRLKLTAPRVHAFNAPYYRKSGLDKDTLKQSNSIIEKALQGNKQLTRAKLASILNQKGIPPGDTLRLSCIMMHAELEGIICSGARKGKQFTYALIEEVAPPVKAKSRDESLAELVTRYFSTRGPATFHDFAWWSGLTIADAKQGMDMVKSKFVQEEFNHQTYWFLDSSLKKVSSLSVHLLPNYDEYFIGFKDRSAIGENISGLGIKDEEVTATLSAHIVISNGQVVGGWKRVLKKDKVEVEIYPIRKLSKAEKELIAEVAEKYGKHSTLKVSLTYKS